MCPEEKTEGSFSFKTKTKLKKKKINIVNPNVWLQPQARDFPTLSSPATERTLNSFTLARNAVSWRKEKTDREVSADELHKCLI